MNYTDVFRQSLLSSKSRLSVLSIKNYCADVNQFVRWYTQTYRASFIPQKITTRDIEQFLISKATTLSRRQRYVSSLRRFFIFLHTNHFTTDNILAHGKEKDMWHIKEFQYYLSVYNSSENTIKYYSLDVKQFLRWVVRKAHREVTESVSDSFIRYIDAQTVKEYRAYLEQQPTLSHGAIGRKYAAIRKYVAWLEKEHIQASLAV